MNVSLPADLKRWVQDQVRARGFQNSAEYVRDMLRRAREKEARLELDAQLREAVESGANIVMDNADWASIRKAARAATKKKSGR